MLSTFQLNERASCISSPNWISRISSVLTSIINQCLNALIWYHTVQFGDMKQTSEQFFFLKQTYLFNEQRSVAVGIWTGCDLLKSYLGHWMSLPSLWPLFLKLVPRSLERGDPLCSPGEHGELLPAHSEKWRARAQQSVRSPSLLVVYLWLRLPFKWSHVCVTPFYWGCIFCLGFPWLLQPAILSVKFCRVFQMKVEPWPSLFLCLAAVVFLCEVWRSRECAGSWDEGDSRGSCHSLLETGIPGCRCVPDHTTEPSLPSGPATHGREGSGGHCCYVSAEFALGLWAGFLTFPSRTNKTNRTITVLVD